GGTQASDCRLGAPQSRRFSALRGLFGVWRCAAAGFACSAMTLLTTAVSAQGFGWSDPYAQPPPPSAWQQAAESLTFQPFHEDAPNFLRYQPAWHERPEFRAQAAAPRASLAAASVAAAPPGPTAQFASYAAQGPQTPDLY